MNKEFCALIFIFVSIIFLKFHSFFFLLKKRKKEIIPLKVLFFVGSILLTILLGLDIGKVNLKFESFINGFLSGYFIFFISLSITRLNIKDSLNFILKSLKNIFAFVKNNFILALRRFLMVSIEEIFWRMILISLVSKNIIKSQIIAGIFISFVFTIDHFPNKRRYFLFVEWFELFLFSLILSIYYIFTKDIISIILMHFIRNINIDFYFRSSFLSGNKLSKFKKVSRKIINPYINLKIDFPMIKKFLNFKIKTKLFYNYNSWRLKCFIKNCVMTN